VSLRKRLPMTPVMLAEYVRQISMAQQRQTSEEALDVEHEPASRRRAFPSVCGRAASFHEIIEEAAAIKAALIVMTSQTAGDEDPISSAPTPASGPLAKCSVPRVRINKAATSGNSGVRVLP